MFVCIYCGCESKSETAKFCSQCGPDCPAHSWRAEDIDQKPKVSQYASLLSEYFFDSYSDAEIEKLSLRMRERFKISHDKHVEVLSKLSEQKKAIAHLSNFRFEFNENVTDAYAGHDTFLDFRYTNLSQDDAFKVSLLWDDPETSDRVDLRAESKSFIKPLTSLTIGGSAVFDRIGIKEISDLQITITDQFGESAQFRAEAFRFKVANHEQRITNNISTHNQISIEGRGVVDATGMGAGKSDLLPSVSNQPSWKQLSFSYVPIATIQNLFADHNSQTTTPVEQNNANSQNLEAPIVLAKSSLIDLPKDGMDANAKNVIEIRVPDIGDFKDVVVIELLVKVGDFIQKEQSVITVESDKCSMEIPSSESGIVKEFRVKLGDRVNEGSLVLVLEDPNSIKVPPIIDIQSPVVNVYVPSSRQYSRLNLESEILELLRTVRSRSTHWHILVGGVKSVPKLMIKDLILRGLNFVNARVTDGGLLAGPRDLAAILCGLDENSLLELDRLEEIFSSENRIGELLYPVLENFQLDVMVGEGSDARHVKLDLPPFNSIFFCKNINQMPMTLLNLFDVCFNIEE